MKNIFGIIKNLIPVFCLCMVAAHAKADQLIEIAARPVVAGPNVLLQEIVVNPFLLPDGWGDRAIIPSPEPGKRIEHSLLALAHAMQKYPDMNNVLLHGPARITIRRDTTNTGSERITDAVKDFINSDERWSKEPIDIQFEPITDNFHIPANSDVEIKIVSHRPQRETNRHMFEALLTTDDKDEKQTVQVYARIIPMHEVWFTRRALRTGESPRRDDLEPRLIPSDTGAGHVPANESVEGLELTRPISVNQPVHRRFLVEPIYAKRGDLIDIVATRGAMTITAKATALATGRRGDTILCMNESSNRRLRVTLTDMKRARIEMGEFTQ